MAPQGVTKIIVSPAKPRPIAPPPGQLRLVGRVETIAERRERIIETIRSRCPDLPAADLDLVLDPPPSKRRR